VKAQERNVQGLNQTDKLVNFVWNWHSKEHKVLMVQSLVLEQSLSSWLTGGNNRS
jgi:hypothetical protein